MKIAIPAAADIKIFLSDRQAVVEAVEWPTAGKFSTSGSGQR